MKASELLKLFNSRTFQLVLGAGAVSVAGLKTITIRNLAVTRTSLELASLTITDAGAIAIADPSHLRVPLCCGCCPLVYGAGCQTRSRPRCAQRRAGG